MKRIRNITTALVLSMSLSGTLCAVHAQENEELQMGKEAQIESSENTVTEDPNLEEKDITAEDEQVVMENSDNKSDKKNKRSNENGSSNIFTIIALVLGLGGVGIGAVSFLNVKKLDEKLGKVREGYKKKFADLNGRVESLQQELALTRQKAERNQNEISKLQANQAALRNLAQQGYGQSTPTSQDTAPHYSHTGATASHQPVQAEVRLYCGVPRGGIFSGVSRTQSRQSLYVITDNGGNTGKYSFVDDRDSAMVAARSTSDFLEPGCVISGSANPNFTRVRTITPGTVRKTANGWAIESKAVVELV